MAKIKLTNTAVDAAQPQAQAVELRDTVMPSFLCKTTPAGRKVSMLQYRTNTGDKPVREAAELVASRRKTITGAKQRPPATEATA